MTRGAKSAPASLTETSVSPVAASHITVLLHEAVDALNVQADGVYVDGTFGRGGHSRLILSKLGSKGRLIGLDRDLAAVAHGQTIADARRDLPGEAASGEASTSKPRAHNALPQAVRPPCTHGQWKPLGNRTVPPSCCGSTAGPWSRKTLQ